MKKQSDWFAFVYESLRDQLQKITHHYEFDRGGVRVAKTISHSL